MDPTRLTYELTFPRDLTSAAATRLLVALSGLYRRPRSPSSGQGHPVLVFELAATATVVGHRLTFPRHLAATVRGHLLAVVPNLGLRPATSLVRPWNYVIELDGSYANDEVQPELAVLLLRSLRELRPDEAIIAQFVVTPTAHIVTAPDQPAFYVLGRLAATARSDERARSLLTRALSAYRSLRVFSCKLLSSDYAWLMNDRATPRSRWPATMTAEALAVACGLPVGSPAIPGLELGSSRRLPPDPAVPVDGRCLARSNFVGTDRPLALSPIDRLTHLYVVGPTNSGKTTLLANLIAADMQEGYGVAVMDPLGGLVERVLDLVPPHRQADVILLDLADTERPVGFNILAGADPVAVTGQLVTVFDNLFELSSAPRAIDVLRSTIYTLTLEGLTLLEVPALLEPGPRGQRFRDAVVRRLTNPELLTFWRWYDHLSSREQSEVAAPILRRLRPLLLYPALRATLGQARSGFDMAEVLTERKILLVPFPSGQLGDETATLVAVLVATRLWNAVQARGVGNHRPFYWYLDEFHDVLTHLPIAFSNVTAQGRNFRLGLHLAHQHLGQISRDMREEIAANVRNKIVYQTTQAADALAVQLGDLVTGEDVARLGPFEVLLRLTVGGKTTAAMTGVTAPPLRPVGHGQAVRTAARRRYGRPAAEVEAEIETRHTAGRTSATSATSGADGRSSSPVAIGWEDWPE